VADGPQRREKNVKKKTTFSGRHRNPQKGKKRDATPIGYNWPRPPVKITEEVHAGTIRWVGSPVRKWIEGGKKSLRGGKFHDLGGRRPPLIQRKNQPQKRHAYRISLTER